MKKPTELAIGIGIIDTADKGANNNRTLVLRILITLFVNPARMLHTACLLVFCNF